jgi:hypothetical protein
MRASTVTLMVTGMLAGFGTALMAAPAPDQASRPAFVEVRDGKITAHVDNVPFAQLRDVLQNAALVDVRVTDAALDAFAVTVNVPAQPLDAGMARVLADFNFARFVDPKTGRTTYLVSSLSNDRQMTQPPVAPAARAPSPAVTLPVATSSSVSNGVNDGVPPGKDRRPAPIVQRVDPKAAAASAALPRSLDDLQPIKPLNYEMYASPEEVAPEVQRFQKEQVDRALAVLASPDYSIDLQRQALNDLVGSQDPRAQQALRATLADPRLADNPYLAEMAANAAWRNAANLQFGNAAANQLLQTLAQSPQPQFNTVGQAAVRDMNNYLAKTKPPGSR